MAYTRMTEEDRKLIYRWRQDDTSQDMGEVGDIVTPLWPM